MTFSSESCIGLSPANVIRPFFKLSDIVILAFKSATDPAVPTEDSTKPQAGSQDNPNTDSRRNDALGEELPLPRTALGLRLHRPNRNADALADAQRGLTRVEGDRTLDRADVVELRRRV